MKQHINSFNSVSKLSFKSVKVFRECCQHFQIIFENISKTLSESSKNLFCGVSFNVNTFQRLGRQLLKHSDDAIQRKAGGKCVDVCQKSSILDKSSPLWREMGGTKQKVGIKMVLYCSWVRRSLCRRHIIAKFIMQLLLFMQNWSKTCSLQFPEQFACAIAWEKNMQKNWKLCNKCNKVLDCAEMKIIQFACPPCLMLIPSHKSRPNIKPPGLYLGEISRSWGGFIFRRESNFFWLICEKKRANNCPHHAPCCMAHDVANWEIWPRENEIFLSLLQQRSAQPLVYSIWIEVVVKWT